MMDVMHVVSGALVHPGREGLLMGLRPGDASRPFLWELPGGKVEPGDHGDPRAALAREWREEIELVVSVGERIATAQIAADVLVLIELFEVSFVRPAQSTSLRSIDLSILGHPPRSIAHEETRWVRPDVAVRDLPCSPGFYGHYPFLRLWWERMRRLTWEM